MYNKGNKINDKVAENQRMQILHLNKILSPASSSNHLRNQYLDAKIEVLDDSVLLKRMQKNAEYQMSPIMSGKDNIKIVQQI